MAITSKPTFQYHKRSTSLPCRSHPSTARIQQELEKLNTPSSSSPSITQNARAITNGLSTLHELYKCMEELLDLPLSQQGLSSNQNIRCVDDFLDMFMSLLDVCGTARDFMSQIKQQGRDLQSSLRRRKGDSVIEVSITRYTSFRMKTKKEAKKFIAVLKQMENKIVDSPMLELDDRDRHISSVIRAIREVVAGSIRVLHSLLLFLSVPTWKPKPIKQSLVLKFFHKGSVASIGQLENVNELQNLDVALQYLSRCDSNEGDKMSVAQSSLKSLEVSIEAAEDGLDGLFRGLIKARASLLNIEFA